MKHYVTYTANFIQMVWQTCLALPCSLFAILEPISNFVSVFSLWLSQVLNNLKEQLTIHLSALFINWSWVMYHAIVFPYKRHFIRNELQVHLRGSSWPLALEICWNWLELLQNFMMDIIYMDVLFIQIMV